METVVGLDLHLKKTQGTIMDKEGIVLKTDRFETTKEGVAKFLESVPKGSVVALEALGFCWPWIDCIEELGYVPKLASPSRLRVIADTRIKTDKIDSETIAQLARMGWLPESYVPSKEFRKLRSLARHRNGLVKIATMCKNRTKSSLRKYGVSGDMNLKTALGKKLAESSGLLEVEQNLCVLKNVEELIKQNEKTFEKQYGSNEVMQILRSIPGFGLINALSIYAEVCDIERFVSTDKFAHYCGLAPSTHQSGERSYNGKMMKANKWLKLAMIEATWMHIVHCPNSRISKAYKSAFRRKKNKNKAIVVAARKMTNVIYHIWKNNEKFDVNA